MLIPRFWIHLVHKDVSRMTSQAYVELDDLIGFFFTRGKQPTNKSRQNDWFYTVRKFQKLVIMINIKTTVDTNYVFSTYL
jgi:hypothetical protein